MNKDLSEKSTESSELHNKVKQYEERIGILEEKLHIIDENICHIIKYFSNLKQQSPSCVDELSWLPEECEKNSSFSTKLSDVEEIGTSKSKRTTQKLI